MNGSDLLAIVAVVVSIAVGIITILMLFIGRSIKRLEDKADSRDNAIDSMVEHFNPNSELAKHLGGKTMPDRITSMEAKLDHIDHNVGEIVTTEIKSLRHEATETRKLVVETSQKVEELSDEVMANKELLLQKVEDLATRVDRIEDGSN